MSEDAPQGEVPRPEDEHLQIGEPQAGVPEGVHIPVTENVESPPTSDQANPVFSTTDYELAPKGTRNVEKAEVMAHAQNDAIDNDTEKEIMKSWLGGKDGPLKGTETRQIGENEERIQRGVGEKEAGTAGDVYEARLAIDKLAEELGISSENPHLVGEFIRKNAGAYFEYGHKIIENMQKYGERLTPAQEAFELVYAFVVRSEPGRDKLYNEDPEQANQTRDVGEFMGVYETLYDDNEKVQGLLTMPEESIGQQGGTQLTATFKSEPGRDPRGKQVNESWDFSPFSQGLGVYTEEIRNASDEKFDEVHTTRKRRIQQEDLDRLRKTLELKLDFDFV